MAFGLGILVYYLVGQWTHAIPHRKRHDEAQTKLLGLIAKALKKEYEAEVKKIVRDAFDKEDVI